MSEARTAGKIILEGPKMQLTLARLCHQLAEQHGDFSNSCFVGIQRTGVPLMQRLIASLTSTVLPEGAKVQHGKLDVTFYRDDFRRGKNLEASPTDMPFIIEGKRVILIDDVLYTGRTIRAALDALLHYGRPEQVELLTLIDRRFTRDLPIQTDYVGMVVDTLDQSYVEVVWGETPAEDKILHWPAGKN